MITLMFGLEFLSLCLLAFFLMPAMVRFDAPVDWKQLDVFKPNYQTQDKLIITIERFYRYAYWYVGAGFAGVTTSVVWTYLVNFTIIEYRMIVFLSACTIGVVGNEVFGKTKEVIRFLKRWDKEGISREAAVTLLNPKIVDMPEPTILQHYDASIPDKYVVTVLVRRHNVHNAPLFLYAYSDVPVPNKFGGVCQNDVELIHPRYKEQIIGKINMDYNNHSMNSYSFVSIMETQRGRNLPTLTEDNIVVSS